MLRIKPIKDKVWHTPVKSYFGDAGWDVRSTEHKILQPGESYRFMLGFRIIGERGKVYTIEDRSSMAMKGIAVKGKVIDNGYNGEVSVILQNHNAIGEIEINDGDKIAQLLIQLVEDDNILLIDNNYIDVPLKAREQHGTGSSGV